MADGADGADGTFGPRTDPDHPASSSAFTSEGNVDAQHPKERLLTAQAAGECAGILGPAGALTQKVVAAAVGAGAPKVGGRLAKARRHCPSMSRARPLSRAPSAPQAPGRQRMRRF